MVKVIGTSVGNFSRMCHSGTIYQSSDTEAPIKRPGSPDNASGGSETGRSDAEPESSGDLLELLRKLAPPWSWDHSHSLRDRQLHCRHFLRSLLPVTHTALRQVIRRTFRPQRRRPRRYGMLACPVAAPLMLRAGMSQQFFAIVQPNLQAAPRRRRIPAHRVRFHGPYR